MSNIILFEILLVIVIIGIQLFVFALTFRQIKLFKRIIPETKFLKVSKLNIPLIALETLDPDKILNQRSTFTHRPIITEPEEEQSKQSTLFDPPNNEKINVNIVQVNIIESKKEIKNPVFKKILSSINNYLIRNRGASSDFNLIKDIIERNTNAVEEDINLTISIPLYLGLMGTMLGIVIALFNMPSISPEALSLDVSSQLDEGISVLIGGVKVAMIASFTGLGLTIINSGWFFKGSRSLSEAKKNELYTFIQVELLPIINQGMASTFDSLQRNLLKFNEEFSLNLKDLKNVFGSSKETMEVQRELIKSMDKTKMAQMTKYNVQILTHLNASLEKFEKFNAYMDNVNEFVKNSQLIVGRANDLLARTDNLSTIAEEISSNISLGHQLLTFVNEHYDKLEEHKQFTQEAVADVGFSISETFEELHDLIANSTEILKKFSVDETDALKTALSESRTNLGNLEHLSTLKADVALFKDSTASQGERIKQALEKLNNNMADSISILEELKKKEVSVSVTLPSLKDFFKLRK